MIESFGLAVILGLVLVTLYFAVRIVRELASNWLRASREREAENSRGGGGL